MFEADIQNFNQEMLEKLLKLSPTYQAQLISKVRKLREERTKQELQIVIDKEKKLKYNFDNPNILEYVDSTY